MSEAMVPDAACVVSPSHDKVGGEGSVACWCEGG